MFVALINKNKFMKKILFIAFAIMLSGIYAQVAINTDGTDPDGSAMLEVKSTDKGFLMPRMNYNTMNGIQNPAEGLLVYVQDKDAFYYFDGTEWILASADNLGNHKATENLQMQGHWITNDGDDEGIFVTDQGNVGIGTDSPRINGNGQEARMHVLMDGSTANVVFERNEDAGRVAGLVFLKSRGTNNAKAKLEPKDGLTSFAASGYDGTEYIPAARIAFLVENEPVSQGQMATRIRFYTRNLGDNKPKERMVLNKDGYLGINLQFPQRPLHVKDVLRLEPRDSAPSNPSEGDIYYRTNEGLMFYNGQNWIKITGSVYTN